MVGFKWHQLERQPHKHWLLWLGPALQSWEDNRCSHEDLGIEVTNGIFDGTWFCWLRSDVAHRYSRLIHVRHIRTRGDLVKMIEGITGCDFQPVNNMYGAMHTTEQADRLNAEAERFDRRVYETSGRRDAPEKDPTCGRPLREHLEAHEAAKVAAR